MTRILTATGAIALLTMGLGATTAMAENCAGFTAMQPATLASIDTDGALLATTQFDEGMHADVVLAAMIVPLAESVDEDGVILATMLEQMRPADGNGFVPGVFLATDVPRDLPAGIGGQNWVLEANYSVQPMAPQIEQGAVYASLSGLIEAPQSSADMVIWTSAALSDTTTFDAMNAEDFAVTDLPADAANADPAWITAATDMTGAPADVMIRVDLTAALGTNADTTWTVFGSGAQA
jgi:hypothetical protein